MTAMAGQYAIYEATLRCQQTLRDSGAVPCLQEWAENCLADLNLWARGAGALKIGKPSLDSRLASNLDSRDFVVNLLGMLQGLVEKCVDIECQSNDGLSHTSELSQAMQDAKSLITQLSRITASIRKAGTNSRIQKADASYDPSHPQIRALYQHLLLLLLAKPNRDVSLLANPSSCGMSLVSCADNTMVADSGSLTVIQNRLIEANLKRRNRFLYAQRHAMKLSEKDEVPSSAIPTPRKLHAPLTVTLFKEAADNVEFPKAYSVTTATEVQGPIPLPAQTSVQPATTVISAISSSVTYPKPPSLRIGQDVFRCPCCCQALSASTSRGSQWNHVESTSPKISLPYTCILADCTHPETLYQTKEAWLSHMFKEHGGVSYWICLACNDTEERPVFYEKSAFAAHLEFKHSRGIKPPQIPMLVSAWLRKAPVTVRSCPLCAFDDPVSNVVLNHTAQHVHSFSLRSLPWAPGENESGVSLYGDYFDQNPYFDTGRSNDTGSNQALSTTSTEQSDMGELPSMDANEEPSDNGQLTEERLDGLAKHQNTETDILDAFLKDIGIQEPFEEIQSDTTYEPSGLPLPDAPAGPVTNDSGRYGILEERTQRRKNNDYVVIEESLSSKESEKSSECLEFKMPMHSNPSDGPLSSLPNDEVVDEVSSAVVKRTNAAILAGARAAGIDWSLVSAAFTDHIESMNSGEIQFLAGSMRPLVDRIILHDEDYFEDVSRKLFFQCSDWALHFSKCSEHRSCRVLEELHDDEIANRFYITTLDGKDAKECLADYTQRHYVFLSVLVTILWESIFMRYLFGVGRKIRQELKRVERGLNETQPQNTVNHWRAVTLYLIAQDDDFKKQQTSDTEAVVTEIFETLCRVLPPPTTFGNDLLEALRKVLQTAVDQAFEMRTQLAEYTMLPPLEPEYDDKGDLVRKVYFNARLMNEYSGNYSSNEELESQNAVVKFVLFPLIVKKGDDEGKGDVEVLIFPAQVLVAGESRPEELRTPDYRGDVTIAGEDPPFSDPKDAFFKIPATLSERNKPTPNADVPDSVPFYEGYTFSKSPPAPGQEPSWTHAKPIFSPRSQDDLLMITDKRAMRIPVLQQYYSLSRARRTLVDKLLQGHRQRDSRFNWTCVYAREEEMPLDRDGGYYETTSLEVVIMRTPTSRSHHAGEATSSTQEHLEREQIHEEEMQSLRAQLPPPPLDDPSIVTLLMKIQLLGMISNDDVPETPALPRHEEVPERNNNRRQGMFRRHFALAPNSSPRGRQATPSKYSGKAWR